MSTGIFRFANYKDDGFSFASLLSASQLLSKKIHMVSLTVVVCLHQGNPISPLLFILVMQALKRLMSKVMAIGFEKGFLYLLDIETGVLLHLLFVDDTLIFFFLINNENFIKKRKTANPSTLGMYYGGINQ